MSARVTAILLSWKRQANMPYIIERIRGQHIPTEIWVINNDGCDGFGADRVVGIPWNAGEWARYVFAARAETEYVMFQDDDFALGGSCFLGDAITMHTQRCPDHILGVAGRGLSAHPPHYSPDIVNVDGYAAILKGHFQLFKPDIVRRVRIPRHPSASDIYWSLDAGNGEPRHYVSANLAKRLRTLDRHGVGYEYRPDHYEERERVCAAWLEERHGALRTA